MYYSRLQEQLASGQTVVTGEIAPPRGASPATLLRVASNLAPAVDALNLTDNQRGLGRMSAMTAAILLRQQPMLPFLQLIFPAELMQQQANVVVSHFEQTRPSHLVV